MKLALSEAAERIGVHPDTLRDWGRQDPPRGPQFTRTAGGHRRYEEVEVEMWIKYQSVPQRFVTGLELTEEQAQKVIKSQMSGFLLATTEAGA